MDLEQINGLAMIFLESAALTYFAMPICTGVIGRLTSGPEHTLRQYIGDAYKLQNDIIRGNDINKTIDDTVYAPLENSPYS